MRQLLLQILHDENRNELLSVIPSSYELCRMMDHNSVELVIVTNSDSGIDFSNYNIYLRFISGNRDLGEVLVNPDDNSEYKYSVSRLYTFESKLEVQVILKDKISNDESRTNIVTFKLSRSNKDPEVFDQNLFYLNRLVIDHKIILNLEDTELVFYDDLENELLRFDIEDMIIPRGGESVED